MRAALSTKRKTRTAPSMKKAWAVLSMKRKARAVLSILLSVLAATGAARAASPSRRHEDARPALTAQERQEARETAARFLSRLRETEHFSALVAEFFVGDFARRLRHDDEDDCSPLGYVSRDAVARSSDEELLRFYVASNNLSFLIIEHLIAGAERREASGEAEEDGELEDLLPAEFNELAAREPALTRWMKSDGDEGLKGESPLNDPGSLRALTDLFERGERVMRRHTPPLAAAQEAERTRRAGGERAEEARVGSPRLLMLKSRSDELPAGARLIGVVLQPLSLLQIELTLVAEDGRLKVLKMCVKLDGD